MPQEFTSSFLFLWITPLNTLRRVEKSTFSGEKTAKKQSFRQKDERNKIPEKRKNDGRAGKADTQKSRNQKLPREKKQKKTKEKIVKALKNMNLSIEQIAQAVELTKKEVEAILKTQEN